MIRIRIHAEAKIYQAPTPRSTDFGEPAQFFDWATRLRRGCQGEVVGSRSFTRAPSLVAFEQCSPSPLPGRDIARDVPARVRAGGTNRARRANHAAGCAARR